MMNKKTCQSGTALTGFLLSCCIFIVFLRDALNFDYNGNAGNNEGNCCKYTALNSEVAACEETILRYLNGAEY